MGVIPAIEAVRGPETPIPLEKFASKYHGFDRILAPQLLPPGRAAMVISGVCEVNSKLRG